MKQTRGDTTVRISEERKLELKRKIIYIGNKTGGIIKTSELVNKLIDCYLNDAVKDIIEENTKKSRNDYARNT